MILKSLESTIKACIFQPMVYLPMLIVTVISLVLTSFIGSVMERPIAEFMLNYDAFMTSNIVFIFLTRYWLELIIVFISIFVTLFVTIVAFFAIAKFVSGKGIIDSIDFSVKNFGKNFYFTIFAFVVGFLALFAFYVLDIIFNVIYSVMPSEVNSLLSLIIFPLLVIVLVVIFITKLGFVLPALLDNKIKDAIKVSWEFTNDKFWSAFLFIIITLGLSLLIYLIFSNIGLFFDLILIFDSIGNIISMSFFALAISYYFFNK